MVLPKNDILEFLQDGVGFFQIVVSPDDAVAPTLLLRDRLRNEEVDHTLLSAPTKAKDDSIGQVKFVAAASLGPILILVAEYGEVVAIRRFGADDLVVQHMPFGFDFMVGNDGSFRVAQQSRVHPGEVTEVGKVLDLPGGVAVPVEGTCVDDLPVPIFEFRDGRQFVSRFRIGEAYPDKPEAFLAVIHGRLGFGRYRRAFRLRYQHAGPRAVVSPSVIGAHDAIISDPAQGKRGSPVDAQVSHRVCLPIR